MLAKLSPREELLFCFLGQDGLGNRGKLLPAWRGVPILEEELNVHQSAKGQAGPGTPLLETLVVPSPGTLERASRVGSHVCQGVACPVRGKYHSRCNRLSAQVCLDL